MLVAELGHQRDGLAVEVSFSVTGGACLALVGPSGAGKTTILRLLSGTMRADRGRIACGQKLWLDSSSSFSMAPELRDCGYVFQDFALFPHLSAWRNVAFGLAGRTRRERSERRARAHEMLERVGLKNLADERPHALSGGERQRVALARALARNPSALLLDEPLTSLDVTTRSEARRTLAGTLRSLEIPAVLVTHDWEDASLLADEIAVIDRGSIVQRGSASELASAPASSFVADLAGAVVLRGHAREGASGSTRIELEGAGEITASQPATGPVAVCVYPWEITIRRSSERAEESAQNNLSARVTSLTRVGNRVRVGLEAPQSLVAEVTGKAADELELVAGADVLAVWKATATKVIPLRADV